MLMSQTPSKQNFPGSREVALMLAIKQNLFYLSVTGEMFVITSWYAGGCFITGGV